MDSPRDRVASISMNSYSLASFSVRAAADWGFHKEVVLAQRSGPDLGNGIPGERRKTPVRIGGSGTSTGSVRFYLPRVNATLQKIKNPGMLLGAKELKGIR